MASYITKVLINRYFVNTKLLKTHHLPKADSFSGREVKSISVSSNEKLNLCLV